MQHSSVAGIISKLENGDHEFVGEIRKIIEAIARKWCWSGLENIDDIAQDCFVKLLQNLRQGKFKGDSSLKTYAYVIVRNTCIDYYKASRSIELADVEMGDLADTSPNAEALLEAKQNRVMAARVLQSLPKECRRLWAAVFFGKKNYLETAQLIGVSEGTVKRKMWECRQLARTRLRLEESSEPWQSNTD